MNDPFAEEKIANLIKEAALVSGVTDIQTCLQKISELLIDQPHHTHLLFARADLYKKQQQFGLAINDYKTILSQENDNKQAKIQIDQLLTILKYQNTDIFENPNTNFDPWLD